MRSRLPLAAAVTVALLGITSRMADAQTRSTRQIARVLGAPSKQWACPKEGSTLRFRTEGGREYATSHTLGRCFPVIETGETESYKLWVDAVDAVIFVFIRRGELAPIVQKRSRLQASTEPQKKSPHRTPGIYVDRGVPVAIILPAPSIYVESDTAASSQEHPTLVQVELPKGDVEGSGWIRRANLEPTSPQRKRVPMRGRRISVPGRTSLLDQPFGNPIASITSTEDSRRAIQLAKRDNHILISYQGEYATAIGWIAETLASPEPPPDSQAEIGLAKIESTLFWVEGGEVICDRPRGDTIGVFARDTELDGRAAKNGWVQFPLATELGTLTPWSPVYSKHAIR